MQQGLFPHRFLLVGVCCAVLCKCIGKKPSNPSHTKLAIVLERSRKIKRLSRQNSSIVHTYLAETLSRPDIFISAPASGVDEASDPPCDPSVNETLFFELACLEDLATFESSPPSPSLDVPLFFPFDPFLLVTPPPFGFVDRL